MGSADIRVVVARSAAPRQTELRELSVPAGATVADALRLAGFDPAGQQLGIWGRLCDAHTLLREGDRVEIYRPLTVDPKEARRLRYRSQRGA